ncbi:MAG TPA: hypothetical protein VM165_10750 [Planctomycetaceae bacterium]|nr:hypothetical protein [Planctomycetaceae bacterium]
MSRAALAMVGALILCGCMKPLDQQVKKTGTSKVIGKKTQDIGEFDKNAGAKVSDSKIHATDPITAPTSAYGPMLERISKTHIEHALNLYNATEGHYPKSYEEFMEQIIKANRIELPVLPGGKKYQYDVENHQLVVIDAPADGTPAP